MKRTNVLLCIFLFLMSSMSVPFSVVGANTSINLNSTSLIKAEDNCTMIAAGSASAFNWWGPTTYIFSAGDWVRGHALESLFAYKVDEMDDTIDDVIPVLATNYTIVDMWPEEVNGDGWTNTGGIHTIDVQLRENVLFHDGSEFNATVAKWNFDRQIVLLGNLTGVTLWTQWKHEFYRPARDYKDFYTTSWNYSSAYNDDPINGAPVTPQYYGKDNDPNLSWTSVSKTYMTDGWVPMINKTLIVKSADETASGTGGTLRFEFNDWQTGLNYLALLEMISMETYGPYMYQIWDQYDFPRETLCVGTGSYEAIEVDKVDKQQMVMKRFDDHWNFTAMRDAGLMIVEDAIVQFYTGSQTEQEKTTAIISGDVDFTDNGAYSPINPDQVISEASVDYFDDGIADSLEQMIFVWEETDTALRKAICYAFDYDNFITVGHEGRAVRTESPTGQNSMWYNDTIEGTYTNLTIARQTLLDDPLYGTLLGLEGLSITSSTQDWHDFADDIESELLNSTYLKAFTINYFHDIYDEDITNTFENSLQDIGMVLNKTNPTGANPYGDWKLTGLESVFDKLIYGLGPYSDHMECFFMSWPIPRPEWGYWDAYYTTVSYYYKPWAMWFDISETWNYGHTSDAAHSKMVHSLYLKEPTERQKTYNDIVEWHIQEEFPNMYICQMEVGYAASRKFLVDWSWGIFNFGYVGIGPGIPTGAEFIPGFPTFALLGFMSVSLFAMVYIVMKKRKLN